MIGEWSPLRAYGGHKRTKWLAWPDLLVAILVICLFFWLIIKAQKLPAYHWNWQLLGEFLVRQDGEGKYQPGLLLLGLFTTLRIGFWTILVSVIMGTLMGVLLVKTPLWLKAPLFGLINLLRNTPPLVILFCVYFFAGNLLPMAEIESVIQKSPVFFQKFIAVCFAPRGQMDAMIGAVLALGAYQSAYVAEIVRGAVQSVPQGQWDAARALGFGRLQTIILVIMPQALRLIIPPMTGQCISTIKESALASLISLPDLTFQSLEIMAVTNMTFEIWVTAGVLYLIIGLCCTAIGRRLENRFSIEYYSK